MSKENLSNSDEFEEGEIVDEYEDISSDEEMSMIQRIQELEATNAELEKIANISGEHFLSNKKRDNGRHERYAFPCGYRYRLSPKYRKKSYLDKKSNCYRYDEEEDFHWDNLCGSRARDSDIHQYQIKLPNKCRSRSQYFDNIPSKCDERNKSPVSNETISSTEDDNFSESEECYLNRDELRFALARDAAANEITSTRKRNNGSSTVITLRERLNQQTAKEHDESSKTLPNFNPPETVPVIDLDDIESDDSMSLEERELRLIALKSAVIKKHIARQKRNAEVAYSPSDFDNVIAEKTSVIDDGINDLCNGDDNGMEISPVASPQYISENEENESEIDTKPVDMELATSDSDEEFPVYQGQNIISVDQIPLPRKRLQSPNFYLDVNDDVPPPPPPFFIQNEYPRSDEECKEIDSEEQEEEEEALRALLLSKLRSPNAQLKRKSKFCITQEQIRKCESSEHNIFNESSADTEVLRNFLINSMNERSTQKCYNNGPKYQTATILKEAVRRLTNKSSTDYSYLDNEFECRKESMKIVQQESDESNSFDSPSIRLEMSKTIEPQIIEPNSSLVAFSTNQGEIVDNILNNLPVNGNLIDIKIEPIKLTPESQRKTEYSNSPKNAIDGQSEAEKETLSHNSEQNEYEKTCETFLPEDETNVNRLSEPEILEKSETNDTQEDPSRESSTPTAIVNVVLENEDMGKLSQKSIEKPIDVSSVVHAAKLVPESCSIQEIPAKNSDLPPTILRKKIVKPNKVINAVSQKRKSTTTTAILPPPAKKIALSAQSSSTPVETLSTSSRLVTAAEATSKTIQNRKLIITLRASDTESSDDDFDSHANISNHNDYYDNASPISLPMGSNPPTRCSSPNLESTAIIPTESQIQLNVVNDIFQTKLDEFLKNARSKVQKAAETITDSPKKTPIMNSMAVRHLPKTSQEEYLRLVNRMKTLERQKLAKKSDDKFPDKTEIRNTKSSLVTTASTNKLIKKVLIKNANNVTNDDNLKSQKATTSLNQPNSSKVNISKEKYLSAYEAAFVKTGSNILSNLDKSLNLVAEAKKAKMNKLRLEEQLEKLRKEIDDVQSNIQKNQDIIMKIYPAVSSSYDAIVSLRQRRMKINKIVNDLGRNLKGDTYRLVDDKKKLISQKFKKLAEETKIVNTMKFEDLEKLKKNQKDFEEATQKILQLENESHKNMEIEEVNLVAAPIDSSKRRNSMFEKKLPNDDRLYASNTNESETVDFPTPVQSDDLESNLTRAMLSNQTVVPETIKCSNFNELNVSNEKEPSQQDQESDQILASSIRISSLEEVSNENDSESIIMTASEGDTSKINCETKQTIKEYISPLGYTNTFGGRRLCNLPYPDKTSHWKRKPFNFRKQFDPNGIICPYELKGQCDDKDCKFVHLDGAA